MDPSTSAANRGLAPARTRRHIACARAVGGGALSVDACSLPPDSLRPCDGLLVQLVLPVHLCCLVRRRRCRSCGLACHIVLLIHRLGLPRSEASGRRKPRSAQTSNDATERGREDASLMCRRTFAYVAPSAVAVLPDTSYLASTRPNAPAVAAAAAAAADPAAYSMPAVQARDRYCEATWHPQRGGTQPHDRARALTALWGRRCCTRAGAGAGS